MLTNISNILKDISGAIGIESETIILVLIILIGAIIIFKISSKGIRSTILRMGGKAGDVQMLIGFWKFIIFFLATIMILDKIFNLGAVLAAFGAFGGMLLGWSLQQPFSGFVAWILITLKRPFKAGDRIQLPSSKLVGDVMKVGPMYVVLNQVGGTVRGEEAVGRHVLIPNSMLFSNLVVNYTPSIKMEQVDILNDQRRSTYVLDEVVARITFDSNWDEAESILINSAREATSDIITTSDQKPYIRSEMYDYGIMMRIRYMAPATDRPRIVHEITKRIFKEFTKNEKVDFAIPYIYSSKKAISPSV
jgi:small-conductance mechanosensitive channel